MLCVQRHNRSVTYSVSSAIYSQRYRIVTMTEYMGGETFWREYESMRHHREYFYGARAAYLFTPAHS